MKRLTYLWALPALALLAGCAQQEESAEMVSAAAAVREIPMTTTSDEARAVFMQGQHALDMGRFQDANALFKQAAEKDPQFTYAYINVMNAASSADDFMSNLELAEANMAAASEGEQLLVKIARTTVDVDVAKRLELSRQLVEAYPASPRALLNLAGVQTGLDEITDARATMNRALELDPNFVPTQISLGFSYLFNEPKDFAVAERHMRRVVELEPEEANAQVNLGDVFRAMNMLEQARDSYARGAELDPSSDLALSKKGHADSFLGNYDEARTDFEQAVEAARDQLKATWARFGAFVSAYEGNPEAAVSELDGIYASIEQMGIPEHQLNGAKIATLSNQATIALHHGMLDAAEQAIEQRGMYMRAQAERVGDEDFTRAQEANIAIWEGRLAARKGDYETARTKAAEVATLVEVQTNPRRMEGYHALMGLTSLLQRNHQEAVEHYRQANKNNIYHKYHLALALEGAGNAEEAMSLFKEVAEFNFNSAAYACIRNDAIERAQSARV